MPTVFRLPKGAKTSVTKTKHHSVLKAPQTTVEKISTISEQLKISDNRATPSKSNKCTLKAISTCNPRHTSKTYRRTRSSQAAIQAWSMLELLTVSYSSTICQTSNSAWVIRRFRLVVKEVMHCPLQMAFCWMWAAALALPTSLTWPKWTTRENRILPRCRTAIRSVAAAMPNISRILSMPGKK
jgi:hypothetical protein